MIPKTHPRYVSLITREKLVKCLKKGIVHQNGLIAHGRGEAFDYLLGEKTHNFAVEAITAATAKILLSKRPVLSVNGNVAALVPEEISQFQKLTGIPIEINLFHRTISRLKKIKRHLEEYGISVIPFDQDIVDIRIIESDRALVSKRGIFSADTIIVPLEDGDRTSALKFLKKFVIAIDLNPMSRTAQTADITIVDNITRVMPLFSKTYKKMKKMKKAQIERIISRYDNRYILQKAEFAIRGSKI